jgi:hypothetical protein
MGSNIQNIKKHAFFATVDWDLLEQKQIQPPFLPYGIDYYDGFIPVPDLKTLLTSYGKGNYLEDCPDDDLQKHFSNW